MSQFFGQNFLKAQYFNPAYLHGAQEEQTGRSGYWRLFFYQMQEEALRQYKEKTGKEVAEPQVVTEVVTKKPASKKIKKVKPVVVDEKPVSKPLPIYQPVKDATEDLVKSIWVISSELHVTMLQIPQYITLLNVKQVEMQQAANDAEVRVRLLLLAA